MPSLGIVGAGLALVASYLVVLALMYVFTQRLFPVPYEWGRLARVVLASAALVGLGELLMPTEGAAGLLGRVALWCSAYPALLLASGFFTDGERRWLALLRHPRELVERLRGAPRGRAAGAPATSPRSSRPRRCDEDALRPVSASRALRSARLRRDGRAGSRPRPGRSAWRAWAR